MAGDIHPPAGANAGSLGRLPEKLVVEGFCRWMAGTIQATSSAGR
ncbi:hypothetical protein [Breoghania sp.]|nr:hypothetical protein [Breoghania sp.]MDJ0932633.1 hypothetical protein [Breoghania sp.]